MRREEEEGKSERVGIGEKEGHCRAVIVGEGDSHCDSQRRSLTLELWQAPTSSEFLLCSSPSILANDCCRSSTVCRSWSRAEQEADSCCLSASTSNCRWLTCSDGCSCV